MNKPIIPMTIILLMLSTSFVGMSNNIEKVSCDLEEYSSPLNEPPYIPEPPLGPIIVYNLSGEYITYGIDPDGDLIKLRFDWDADGSHDYSNWSMYVASGIGIGFEKTWDRIGTYLVKAQAKDEHGALGEWSEGLTVFVKGPPEVPMINGPSTGMAGKEYNYTFVTTDPDGHDVSYYINWDDGNIEEWVGPYSSGEEIIVSHIWEEQGTYTIKVKAKDIYGAESEWGYLEVEMPVSYNSLFLRFLERLIEHFPLLERILIGF